jgi:hypothetical protein
MPPSTPNSATPNNFMNQTGAGAPSIVINTGSGSGQLNGGITGQTGGGSANLDGQVTATMTLNSYVAVGPVGGPVHLWQLIAGTQASTPGQYQRGSDYNGVTNARVFVIVL